MAALNLVIGAKVTESVEQCKKDIQDIVAQLDKDPPKIKVQFDYNKEELKKLQEAAAAVSKTTSATGGGSSGMHKVADDAKKAKTATAELAAQISKVNAALKEMQSTNKTIDSAYEQIKKYLGGENGNAESAASLESLRTKYLELHTAIENLRQTKKTATQEDIQGVYDLQAEMQKLLAPIQERIAAEKEASRVTTETAKQEIAAAEAARKASDPVAWDQALKQYSTALGRAKTALIDFSAAQHSSKIESQSAYSTIKDCADEAEVLYAKAGRGEVSLDELHARIAKINRVIAENGQIIRANGDGTKTLSERLSKLATKFGAWLSVSQVIMLAVRSVRKMISTSIELDDALTQMQVVTRANANEMDKFGDSAANAAKKVGSSISDFVDSATTYARLGYNMDVSSQLAQYTAMLQNVGKRIA